MTCAEEGSEGTAGTLHLTHGGQPNGRSQQNGIMELAKSSGAPLLTPPCHTACSLLVYIPQPRRNATCPFQPAVNPNTA